MYLPEVKYHLICKQVICEIIVNLLILMVFWYFILLAVHVQELVSDRNCQWYYY